jgi:uncharacterized repeat protein (TIGR02543 family)
MNSNSAAQVPAQTVAQGGKVTKPADPTRNNYIFGGWYKDADLTTEWDFDADIVSANATIYAKWNNIPGADTVTITFDANGGSDVPTQTVTKGTTISKPGDPVRSGYIFDGWYRDSDLTTEWDFDADIVTANATIYAKWSEPSGIVTAPWQKPSKSLTAIKNGFVISAAKSASMTVFGLNGNVLRKQAFTGGNHTVRLGGLPSGMYLVRADVDGVKRVVRVAVR